MASIGEQIVTARKAKGWTQDALAEALNVSRSSVANWEGGRRIPDGKTLLLLSKVLDYSFETERTIQSTEEAPGDKSADINQPAAPVPPAMDEKPAEGKTRWKGWTKKKLWAAACALIAVVLACLLLLPSLRSKPADSVPAADGTRYAIADYDQTTPKEPGKAYLTIIKTLSVRPGDGKDYYAINFTMREDNGIAFTIDRLELVIFSSDHASVFAFSHDDLANADLQPDMPAYGFLSIDNGFPTDQKGLQGMSIKIIGTDANGASLTFTSYLPIP